VLEDYGLSNALILERACREAGLPSPLQPIPGDPLGRKRSYVALSRRHANALLSLGLVPGPEHKTHSGSLARLLEAHRANPALDVQLVPVSIFVGQAPNRSRKAGSACCSQKTGRWWAASAACWRSCSTVATPWCSSRRR
jgi:glycerol-3-phosphate O-acyltransferase